MKRKYKIYLFLILALALVLRLVGITHGFPFIFHPDEPTVIRSALGVRFNLNPGHFDWPHLFIYMNYFLYMAFAKLRTFLEFSSLKPYVPGIVWDDNLIFYLLTRIFAAILGALTTIPVFLSGRKLFGEKVGILAALVFAILPFHVWHSHYSLIDVPMVFFLAWGIYFSIRIIVYGLYSDSLLAGLFVGLAASTKYNGALGVLMIVLAHIFRLVSTKKEERKIKSAFIGLILAGVLSILGFLAGTPYSVLDHETFVRTDGPQGALWQFTNVGRVSITELFSQLFEGALTYFPVNLGITFWIIYLAGIAYILINLKKNTDYSKVFYLYLISLFFFSYVSGLEKTRAHYFMIAYPLFALVVGYLLGQVLEFIPHRKLQVIFLSLVILSPLASSMENTMKFARKDTRVEMYEWLTESASEEDIIFYDSDELAPVLMSAHVTNDVRKNKVLPLSELGVFTGYFINASDSNSQTAGLSPVGTISNEHRRGPQIKIYPLDTLTND